MNIVVDENIPNRSVSALRELGHVVFDVRGTPSQGVSDEDLLDTVRREKALLVTTDKGFSRTVHEPHYGVLVIRLRQPNRAKIHERIMLAVSTFEAEAWPGMTVVMRDEVQSVRRSAPPDA